jgi:hypothetical protein
MTDLRPDDTDEIHVPTSPHYVGRVSLPITPDWHDDPPPRAGRGWVLTGQFLAVAAGAAATAGALTPPPWSWGLGGAAVPLAIAAGACTDTGMARRG